MLHQRLFYLIAILLGLLLSSPMLQAWQAIMSVKAAESANVALYLPLILKNGTDEPLPQNTATPTRTSTSVASTATSTATHTRTPTATSTPTGCTVTEFLVNGNFEAGLTPQWQLSTGDLSSVIDEGSPSHSGSWKAWLGGYDSITNQVFWQSVSVPANATGLQVSYWWLVSTDEPTPSTNDSLEIQIRDASGAVLQKLDMLFDGNLDSVWAQTVTPLTSNYAGQTIQIAFIVTTDSSYTTSFFIDDVSIQTCR